MFQNVNTATRDALDDELGFRPIEEMSSEEIARETLMLNREIVKAFVGLSRNPLIAGMVPGLAGKR